MTRCLEESEVGDAVGLAWLGEDASDDAGRYFELDSLHFGV